MDYTKNLWRRRRRWMALKTGLVSENSTRMMMMTTTTMMVMMGYYRWHPNSYLIKTTAHWHNDNISCATTQVQDSHASNQTVAMQQQEQLLPPLPLPPSLLPPLPLLPSLLPPLPLLPSLLRPLPLLPSLLPPLPLPLLLLQAIMKSSPQMSTS